MARGRSILGIAAGLMVIFAIASATSAVAAVATRVGGTVTVTAVNDGNAVNRIQTVAAGPAPHGMEVVDHARPLMAGMGCLQGMPNQAFCGDYSTVTLIVISGGGGNDLLENISPSADTSPVSAGLYGNEGNDRLVGGSGNSTLDGGAGNDIVGGYAFCCAPPVEAGNDRVFGGLGDDRLVGGEGNDSLDGGPGTDTGDYGQPSGGASARSPARAVKANLSSGRAIGAGADTLARIENLVGSRLRDVLTGNGGANRLVGGRGKDRLRGRGGADNLRARDGKRDVVSGGSGRDRGRVDRGLDRVFSVEIL